MMDDTNPYAPPKVQETERPSSQRWRVDGISVLVKDEAVLPQVDLETGEVGQVMKKVQRKFQPPDLLGLYPILIYFPCSHYMRKTGWESYVPYVVVAVSALVILVRLLLKGRAKKRIIIWEFHSDDHHRKSKKRRLTILFALFLIAATGMAPVFLIPYSQESDLPLMAMAFVLVGMLCVMLWAYYTGNKSRTLAGPPGWLKITPVHPDALEYLRNLSRMEDADDGPEQSVCSPEGAGDGTSLLATMEGGRHQRAGEG